MRGAVRGGVKAVAAGRDLLARRAAPGLTVLIYHRVGGPGGEVDLDPARFEDQVAELAAEHEVVSLDEALAHPAGRRPDRPQVVLTFDDGTRDFTDHALPILVRHRVPALLYLATRFADEGLDFPGGGPAVSWSGLRDALSTGLVAVGSHTHSHVLLDRAAPEEVARELDRSCELIEHHLGRPARHFAYPKALLGTPATRSLVQERFASAAIAGTRTNPWSALDPHALHRSPIQVGDGMRWFRHKVRGGLRLEDDLRRLANRRRYAGATS